MLSLLVFADMDSFGVPADVVTALFEALYGRRDGVADRRSFRGDGVRPRTGR
jgi:hypothetical protein